MYLWKFCSLIVPTATPSTGAHNVKNLAFRLGLGLKLTDAVLDELLLAAAFHDIGKRPVDRRRDPGQAASAVRRRAGGHPQAQRDRLPHRQVVARDRAHRGRHPLPPRALGRRRLPQGKRGPGPLVARVIHLVDAFDMMQRDRPYRKAMAREQALAELRQLAGKEYDPELVQAFERTLSDRQQPSGE